MSGVVAEAAAMHPQACYTVQPSRTVLRPLARRASGNAIARKSYDAAVRSAEKTMTRLPWLQKVRHVVCNHVYKICTVLSARCGA